MRGIKEVNIANEKFYTFAEKIKKIKAKLWKDIYLQYILLFFNFLKIGINFGNDE